MRADRLLQILLLLQIHGRMTARQLAKRLEVSARTVHRDMEALGAAGVPIVAERGAAGGWELMENFRFSMSSLSEPEIRAVFLATPVRLLEDLRLEKEADAATVKLLALLPELNRRHAELARQRIHIDITGWQRASESVPDLPLLRDAVWRERKVRFTYGDPPHERTVDPLGLVAKGSVWYLVARRGEDLRSYRVSRIRDAEMLDATFTRPAGFDLAQFWERAAQEIRERMPRYRVVARVEESALPWLRAMIRYGGIDKVEGEIVEMHFDAEEVAIYTILGMAGKATVIEPEDLRKKVAIAVRG